MNPHRILPALLLLAACSFDPAGEVQRCERDEDCDPGRSCLQARCTPDDALDMRGGQDLDAPDLPGLLDMSPMLDMQADMPAPDMPAPDMPAPDMPVEPDPCETDVDQDGFGSGPRCPVGRRDCDDNDRLVYPGAPERCNGRDNNCDGQIDAAACDCAPGEREACGLAEGACEPGERVCQPGGRWGECVGGQGPLPETCNGRDDNCDGVIDETFPGKGDMCDTGLPGVCAPGRQTCSQGGLTCAQVASPSVEVCDGLDNDCDGLVDEDDGGLVLTRPCGNACPSRAVQLCIGGAWGACDVTDVELCNGQDTNCDQLVDNTSRCVRACPGGRTASGTQRCVAGSAVCVMPAEICGDMLDNDCDGQIDESCGTPLELRNMVYLAGGTFAMGATQADPYAQSDERPIHLVELSPFYMDRFEATRAQYQACVQAGACSQLNAQCPSQPLSGQDANKPAACVRWQDARDYCVWAGKRLPTEAEWERAARGPWRRAPLWPWGDAEEPARVRMDCQVEVLNQCVGAVDSLPAGQSFEGIYHMAGNVAEYVSDFYDPAFYTPQLAINPQRTAATSAGHVVRGGSWRQSIRFGRTANRAAEDSSFGLSRSEAGIRCARSAP